ncbi:SdpI family protein [Flammeovirga sp. SubArs3]|uniref:SdpI family protein n=1 Tax=Flammeovirga sp. SubArs3 TaxID=2995316 RepID=UPI00248C2353|nr:SdpI family protein [Flammeovirga sp. SubArs3]
MKTLKKDLLLLLVVIAPMAYTAFIWDKLPEKVPMHWNVYGEVDRYGERSELAALVVILPLISYLLFLVIPYIDPKKRIKEMGGKYNSLNWIITGTMSWISFMIIYHAINESTNLGSGIFIGIGIMIMLLGNYFKTIRPNYFVGIRTPWTLESDQVWKETHALSGKIWMVGGVVLILTALIPNKIISFALFMLTIAVIVIIPFVYSYRRYKKEMELKHE